jgi:Dienelactone hydrolase family
VRVELKATGQFHIQLHKELFGVNADSRKHCDELAEQGYLAVAPDLYWRQEPGVDLNVTSEADWRPAFVSIRHMTEMPAQRTSWTPLTQYAISQNATAKFALRRLPDRIGYGILSLRTKAANNATKTRSNRKKASTDWTPPLFAIKQLLSSEEKNCFATRDRAGMLYYLSLVSELVVQDRVSNSYRYQGILMTVIR